MYNRHTACVSYNYNACIIISLHACTIIIIRACIIALVSACIVARIRKYNTVIRHATQHACSINIIHDCGIAVIHAYKYMYVAKCLIGSQHTELYTSHFTNHSTRFMFLLRHVPYVPWIIDHAT